ncbi:DUF397 domain-containing protein [Streptomyces hokutonensis]|uniref:DUF397 domain-containing protein n=1 Tax=Streptomyces hokutonensis TaxID=1306990 RepID=UPI001FE07372|nr:Scr1 family TA system antitoxin-like transcriptional regulator [Streptomyces hokutonensis]
MRHRAGLSGDRAGALLDADRTRISDIEAGRIDVSRNRLYKLLREYGCPPGPLFDGIMAMARESGKGWWEEFNDTIGPAVMRRQLVRPMEVSRLPNVIVQVYPFEAGAYSAHTRHVRPLRGPAMLHLVWQKSSCSTGGEGECVELAAATPGPHIHLRESDHPHRIATLAPHTLAALLHAVKSLPPLPSSK